jgi:hypothetical protein
MSIGRGVGVLVIGAMVAVLAGCDGSAAPPVPGPTVGAAVAVGRTPLRAAGDGDLLWISVFGTGHVVAVDTTTSTVRHDVELGGGPEGIGVGFGSVWVVRQDARVLTQLDRTGTKVGDVAVGTTPRLLAFGRTHVWVSDFGAGTVTRVDPAAGTAETAAEVSAGTAETSAALCQGAQGLAVDAGVVWLACTTSNEVVAVDERTMAVRGRVTVPGEPDAIEVVDGQVWVAATDGPTLVRLSADANAPAVVSQHRVAGDAPLRDRANVDLAAAGAHLWVSALRSNAGYAASRSA